jgi:hypothetical protein
MSALAGAEVLCEVESKIVEHIPLAVLGEFVVRLGEGWGGSFQDLANGLAVRRDGPEAAASTILSHVCSVNDDWLLNN